MEKLEKEKPNVGYPGGNLIEQLAKVGFRSGYGMLK